MEIQQVLKSVCLKQIVDIPKVFFPLVRLGYGFDFHCGNVAFVSHPYAVFVNRVEYRVLIVT